MIIVKKCIYKKYLLIIEIQFQICIMNGMNVQNSMQQILN